ncbi:MAG TPA: glycosyltransferase family 4 protein [Anaerolineaceae bacterium]|nr:glycosyltransferase family 4 protein [Anaerolineaceae bacterium]
MHILLVHQAFAALDEAGGTRHHEMARYLAARGHQVTVIASPVSYLTGTRRGRVKWVDRQTDGPQITILRTYTYSALHRSFIHRVISFLSFMLSSFWVGLTVRNVDLVWGTSPPIFQGVTAWALARLKRVPFLFEVRDLWPAFAIAVGVLKDPFLVKASLWLEGFLYRRADRVMVNSPGYIDHVLAHGARWVELIPNGADPDMFDAAGTGTEFRERYGLDGKFVVLYAGAHGMSNDLNVVLDAARQLRDEKQFCFLLLGDGKEKPALIARAQEQGLKNVLFLPPVPKKEMPQALAASDACVAILKAIPLYATTYPNKVFDYMAAGRPVLLAIDGVIRKVVEEAGAGIAVCPGDAGSLANAVRWLAAQPDRGRSMGQSGRRYVQQHFNRADLSLKLALLLEDLRWNHG